MSQSHDGGNISLDAALASPVPCKAVKREVELKAKLRAAARAAAAERPIGQPQKITGDQAWEPGGLQVAFGTPMKNTGSSF